MDGRKSKEIMLQAWQVEESVRTLPTLPHCGLSHGAKRGTVWSTQLLGCGL